MAASRWEWGGRGGVGMGLLAGFAALYFRDLTGVLLVLLAGALFFRVVQGWRNDSRAQKDERRRYLIGIVVGTLALEAWPLSGMWMTWRASQPDAITEAPKPPPVAESPPPKPSTRESTVTMRCTVGFLPVSLEPKSLVYVVPLNPEMPRWAVEVKNRKDRAVRWPPDTKSKPPEHMHMCEFENQSEKTLLDLVIDFEASFYTVVPIKVVQRPDGKIDVPSPGSDRSSFVRTRSGKAEGLTQGELVKTLAHRFSIATAMPRTTVRVWVINTSTLIAKVKFPSGRTTALIEGERDRISVRIVRPGVTVMDAVPWLPLPPKIYHWKTIPDAM